MDQIGLEPTTSAMRMLRVSNRPLHLISLARLSVSVKFEMFVYAPIIAHVVVDVKHILYLSTVKLAVFFFQIRVNHVSIAHSRSDRRVTEQNLKIADITTVS